MKISTGCLFSSAGDQIGANKYLWLNSYLLTGIGLMLLEVCGSRLTDKFLFWMLETPLSICCLSLLMFPALSVLNTDQHWVRKWEITIIGCSLGVKRPSAILNLASHIEKGYSFLHLPVSLIHWHVQTTAPSCSSELGSEHSVHAWWYTACGLFQCKFFCPNVYDATQQGVSPSSPILDIWWVCLSPTGD